MKKVILFFLNGILLVFLNSGCAQKIQVKAIKSGQISDSAIKDIAVLPFSNDQVSLAIKIDSAFSDLTIKGEKYFNVIDRVNLEKIIAEKKLNDSGLVDLIHNDANTGIKEIRTLVVGEVTLDEMKRTNYLEERTDYESCQETIKDNKGNSVCQKYRVYHMACVANQYSLNANVKFIKVADSKVIFARSFSQNSKLTHCADDNKILPSK
jgi:curli biogenesis system outer membrane secretion channel CsgG